MKKNIFVSLTLAAAALTASAADETMYLVKNDRVVGKYDVDAVDYITFNLPDDVIAENLWLSVDKVGKNSVTYSVNTVEPQTTYAHNLLSYWDVNYNAMDLFGESFENLDEEAQCQCLQFSLSYDAFLGVGTKTYTQNDFEQYDPSSEKYRTSVIPGTQYFLCAWEVTPDGTDPLDTFVYTELTTEDPDLVNLNLDVTMVEVNDYGMQLNFSGSDDILYVRTCWGLKDNMETYAEYYGMDFLMGTFGQNWSMNFLQGSGDLEPGVPNAIWPVYDAGDYVMYVRAYTAEGNMEEKTFVFNYQGLGDEGTAPSITIFSKEKSEGYVKVNFEISPSNVEEAYVRLCGENFADDRLNMGYTLPELAMGGDSIDITEDINKAGEYTYENNAVEEQWNSLIIYAKSKEGGKTTLRINFYPDNDSNWAIAAPAHAPRQPKKAKILQIRRAGVPCMKRLGK